MLALGRDPLVFSGRQNLIAAQQSRRSAKTGPAVIIPLVAVVAFVIFSCGGGMSKDGEISQRIYLKGLRARPINDHEDRLHLNLDRTRTRVRAAPHRSEKRRHDRPLVLHGEKLDSSACR